MERYEEEFDSATSDNFDDCFEWDRFKSNNSDLFDPIDWNFEEFEEDLELLYNV